MVPEGGTKRGKPSCCPVCSRENVQPVSKMKFTMSVNQSQMMGQVKKHESMTHNKEENESLVWL